MIINFRNEWYSGVQEIFGAIIGFEAIIQMVVMSDVSLSAFATTAPPEENDESYKENYDGKYDKHSGSDIFLEFSAESFDKSL